MPSWITFDDETASALRSRLSEQTIVALEARSAVEYMLSGGETTVAVLPCRGLGQAALAVFRWNRILPPVAPPSSQANIRAGGFLGLNDEAILNEEPEEKRSWWKRFWDE